ncbi:MAG: endonuclease [Pseudomonadota bacterium]
MFYLTLHTALLILAVFILGAVFGCVLRHFFASGQGGVYGVKAMPAATAAAAATATVAAKAEAPEPAPTPKPAPKRAPPVEPVAEPVEKPAPTPVAAEPNTSVEMDEAGMAAAIAALPAGASNEDKADAVGTRPEGLEAPEGGTRDDLQRIKGIGKVNEAKLNELGIYHFSQVAALIPIEVRWIGMFLAFPGRIEREDWIGQAATLAAGGETDFAKGGGKGKAETPVEKDG